MTLIRHSEHLSVGHIYSRADLKNMFDIHDATINTGIFQPKHSGSVWLFITENKSSDRTPFEDRLEGDVLKMQGQMKGGKDALLIEHKERGLELLLFYRLSKNEHPHAGFRYEGRFHYRSHNGRHPASFILERCQNSDTEQRLEGLAQALIQEGAFDCHNLEDSRERTLRRIVQRRGQPVFRQTLFTAYQGRCAISGSSVASVLEAAHIHPYQGDATNVVTNGLLLRADLHTLFDLHMLWIEPEDFTIHIASHLHGSEYEAFHGKTLTLPDNPAHHPSRNALENRLTQARQAQKRNAS